jgi:hypothetical protein
MAWKNPFRRKPQEPKRVKPVSEAEVKAKGRKAFATYRELMEQYRSLQEKNHTKSRLLRALAQWWIKRSMQHTNRQLQKKVKKALDLSAKYRQQGGEEIRIKKAEHTQLVGGVPPEAIREIIKAKEAAHAARHRIGHRVELRQPVMLRHRSERLAAAAKEAASSRTTTRHAVKKETQQKVRARLESLYQEFKSQPGVDRIAIQRVFKPLADYARTLKSEEAHTQFDAKLRDAVKLLNAEKPHEAAQLITSLSTAIHARMRGQDEQTSTRPREPAHPTKNAPTPSPAEPREGRRTKISDAESMHTKKTKPIKSQKEKNDSLQGEPTIENVIAAQRTSEEITSILRKLDVASRLRGIGNTAARAQVNEVIAKSLIIYNPRTQARLLELTRNLQREIEAGRDDAASQALTAMAEIASKIKFKIQSDE